MGLLNKKRLPIDEAALERRDGLERALEALGTLAGEERFQSDLLAARAAYFGATGEVYQEDPSFSGRMLSFTEHFVFDCPLSDSRMPLAHRFVEQSGEPVGFLETRHALWEVRKIKHGSMVVRSLFDKEKKDFTVEVGSPMEGVAVGDFFEARVIPFQDRLYFSNAFCFHPHGAKKPIRAAIRRLRKAKVAYSETALIWAVSRMRLKYERYRNIALEGIYDLSSWAG